MEKWIERFDDSHKIQIHNLMKEEWWCADRTLEQVSKVIAGSDMCLAYLDADDRVAAFLRVLTDSIFKAVIFDVIVRSDHRGTGLGRRIIERAIDHSMLASVKSVELYCPDRVSGFYKTLGFTVSSSKLHQLQKA